MLRKIETFMRESKFRVWRLQEFAANRLKGEEGSVVEWVMIVAIAALLVMAARNFLWPAITGQASNAAEVIGSASFNGI